MRSLPLIISVRILGVICQASLTYSSASRKPPGGGRLSAERLVFLDFHLIAAGDDKRNGAIKVISAGCAQGRERLTKQFFPFSKRTARDYLKTNAVQTCCDCP
jgi:hypothetical protein